MITSQNRNYCDCADPTMTTNSGFYHYASPGSLSFGDLQQLAFTSDLPPEITLQTRPCNWLAAIAELYIPEISDLSNNEKILVTGPEKSLSLSFANVTGLKSTVSNINKNLKQADITEVKFAAANGVMSIAFSATDFQVSITRRLMLAFGFTMPVINSDTVATLPFDKGRPTESLRFYSNLFTEISGDFIPSPVLIAQPNGESMVFEKPISLRYLPVNRTIFSMSFQCKDMSGDNVLLSPSVDAPYILLHFIPA